MTIAPPATPAPRSPEPRPLPALKHNTQDSDAPALSVLLKGSHPNPGQRPAGPGPQNLAGHSHCSSHTGRRARPPPHTAGPFTAEAGRGALSLEVRPPHRPEPTSPPRSWRSGPPSAGAAAAPPPAGPAGPAPSRAGSPAAAVRPAGPPPYCPARTWGDRALNGTRWHPAPCHVLGPHHAPTGTQCAPSAHHHTRANGSCRHGLSLQGQEGRGRSHGSAVTTRQDVESGTGRRAAGGAGGAAPQLEDLLLHVVEGPEQPLVVRPALAELSPQRADRAPLHRQQLLRGTGLLLLLAQGPLQVTSNALFLLNLIRQQLDYRKESEQIKPHPSPVQSELHKRGDKSEDQGGDRM